MGQVTRALLITIVVSAIGPSPTSADAADGFTFTSDGIHVTITGCAGDCGPTITIPATLAGKPVTEIGSAAFMELGLEAVTFPDSITSIAADAFYGNNLTSVSIPDSVITIGDWAFSTNELTNLTLGTSVSALGDYAFEDNSLVNVHIPDSVTTIGDYAFEENSLVAISIPSGVTRIGAYTFSNNVISTVSLGSTVTTIGNAAFYLNHLETIDIPNSVREIGDAAFQGNSLTSLVLPDSVLTIGEAAFAENQIRGIEFSSSLTSIGRAAFYRNQISEVALPESVLDIGVAAFQANVITRLSLGPAVENIGAAAFAENRLEVLAIPPYVTAIGETAFAFNDLSRVLFKGDAPPETANVFLGNPHLYSLRRGSNAKGWGDSWSGVPVRSQTARTLPQYTITVLKPQHGFVISTEGFVCAAEENACTLVVSGGMPLTFVSDGVAGRPRIDWTGCTNVFGANCIVIPHGDVTIRATHASSWEAWFKPRTDIFRESALEQFRAAARILSGIRSGDKITVIGYSKLGGAMALSRANKIVGALRRFGVIAPILIETVAIDAAPGKRSKAEIVVAWGID